MHTRLPAILKELALYGLATTIGLLIMVWGFRLQEADLRIPFYYGFDDDTNLTLEMVRSTIKHGWYYTNPDLGAPGTMDLRDFPILDTAHLVAFKLMGFWSDDPFLVANLFYLATYPLSLVTCLFVLRHFGISAPVSVSASLLFAFQPYHVYRGIWHVYLSAYYAVPLAMMVVIWMLQGKPLLFPAAADGVWRFRPTAKGLAAVLIIALIATTGVYYAFFTGFLLATAGAIAFARRPGRARLAEVVVTCGLLVFLIVAQALPFLIHRRVHGKNPVVAKRSIADVNRYSLESLFLLGPTMGHRVAKLRIGDRVDHRPPLEPGRHYLLLPDREIPEGHYSSLGLIGATGYAILIVSAFGWRSRFVRRIPYLGDLAALNMAATILAIQGGLGVFVSTIFVREIRAYNRISIFIALMSLFAVASCVDAFVRSRRKSRGRSAWFPIALVLATALGIFDQVPAVIVPDYTNERATFRSDRAFVERIEAAVPPRSQILQLPYMEFPEVPPTHGLKAYALLRPTFHSHQLRWSAGAVKGRAVGNQLEKMTSRDPAELVDEAGRARFDGIMVHRAGFADGGRKLETALGEILHGEPIVSDDKQLSFYRLRPNP